MDNPTKPSQVTRLSLYIGYGDKGRTLLAQIKALATLNGKNINKLFLDAIRDKYGAMGQPQNKD